MSTLREFLGSKLGLAVCLVLAALGAYLLWSHTGHVLSALPYVVLLACPLLHLFAMGTGTEAGMLTPIMPHKIPERDLRRNDRAVLTRRSQMLVGFGSRNSLPLLA